MSCSLTSAFAVAPVLRLPTVRSSPCVSPPGGRGNCASSQRGGFGWNEARPDTEPIVIEDCVLVGFGAAILRGVTIGAAVVAANAVVTRDFPSGTIVTGNPARVVAKDVVWG